MAMAHQPLAAILGVLVGMAAEEGCDLRLDGLRQQGSRALAQNFGQRVGELCWLDQLDDINLGHGVSLLRWRSGGSNTPTIRRLIPHAVTNFRAYLLEKALAALWPDVPAQRCTVHKHRNLLAHAPD